MQSIRKPFVGFLPTQKLWLVRKLLSERISSSGFFARIFLKVDSMTDTVVIGTPEATVVSVVERYLVLRSMGLDDADAIAEIETYRSAIVAGRSRFSRKIDEYVRYRVRLEHKSGRQISDADILRAQRITQSFAEKLAESLEDELFKNPENISKPSTATAAPLFMTELPVAHKNRPVATYKSGDLTMYYFESPITIGEDNTGASSPYEYPQVIVVCDSKQPLLIVRIETGSHGSFLCSIDCNGSRTNLEKMRPLSKDDFVKKVGEVLMKMKYGDAGKVEIVNR
ncbi:MAG TPA: hypothetical protein PKB01_01775 [Xanthobacteraceae bacterium]|nr:hypothetical protein [Xanthobacteraceae bacterium]